jgi:hypothetical protein
VLPSVRRAIARRAAPVRRGLLGVLLALGLAATAPAWAAEDGDLPEILHVGVPPRLVAGQPAEVRVSYRAPQANVVALIEVVEDLDGVQRATRQREIGVVARAFGLEAGELVVHVSFPTPGRKRLVLVLVTDARAQSDPATIEVDVRPSRRG